MNFNYLKTFYTVCKKGSFTLAAEALHTQQPVVSRAIALLEKDIGEKLFERQKKKIILTDFGKILLKKSEVIFQNYDELEKNITHLIKEPKELRLAFSDSLAFGAIDILIDVYEKNNHIRITQNIGSCSNFINDLNDGHIDMGFFFNVPKLPTTLSKQKLCDVEFVYVVSKEQKKNTSVLNKFINTTDSKYTSNEMPLFKKYLSLHENAKTTFVSSSSLVRKMCALNGIGVTILPKFLVKNEIESSQLVCIGEPVNLSLYIIERQSAYRNKTKADLIKKIKNLI